MIAAINQETLIILGCIAAGNFPAWLGVFLQERIIKLSGGHSAIKQTMC